MNDAGSTTKATAPVGRARKDTRRRRRPRWPFVALLLAVLMVVPGVSYGQALTYPGNASWQERSVEWVRDNGGAGLVNTVENWYYTRHAPPNSAPAAAALPAWTGTQARAATGSRTTTGAPASAPAATPKVTTPTRVPALAGATALPGEGVWKVERTGSTGAPVLYSTILRPDPAYASVVAAAAWIPVDATAAHLVAGTKQPGGSGWGGNAAIPSADLPSVVATFNSGWKYKDLNGGYYANKQSNPPLQDGLASVVIDKQGQVRVGQWGRDVSMRPDVVAVRQNLHLVIDHGAAVPGLDSNPTGAWGSPKNQLQFTWRSGLGTDSAGDLIYVAGDNLTLQSLATAMTDAGIGRGMELDIHPRMVNFAVWNHTPDGHLRATNLLPTMPVAPNRYVVPDQRDFFYLTLP